jgi:NAD kinase
MHRLTDQKVVLVTRLTRLAELIARFNTAGQAKFYVERLGMDFSDYEREDVTYRAALAATRAALEDVARLQLLDRAFLPNFVFGPEDTVVVLGQDGLVANTVKYLAGQPVVGVNPDPARWEGQLLPFGVPDLPRLLPEVLERKRPTQAVTMAEAVLNTGQTLFAVNDLFIGPRSHTSARYVIEITGQRESQSSSGVIVSTGLGSTGWLKSLLTGASAIAQQLGPAPGRLASPEPAFLDRTERRQPEPGPPPPDRGGVSSEFAWDAAYLRFTVREPFPTVTTGAGIVHGRVTRAQPLTLSSHTPEGGVIFSDGIEKDFLEFNSGTRAVIRPAERQGQLVV